MTVFLNRRAAAQYLAAVWQKLRTTAVWVYIAGGDGPCRLVLVVRIIKLRTYCEDVAVLYASLVVCVCVLTLFDVLW
jgi:hypothetical protein